METTYNIEKLEEAFKIITEHISAEGYETDLEKTFHKIDQKIKEDRKSFPIEYIICGVGIVIALVLLVAGKVNANSLLSAAPYKTQIVDIVINNPQISFAKTTDEVVFEQAGVRQKASLWTITFMAPQDGWYEFRYREVTDNVNSKFVSYIKTYTMKCNAGVNVFPNSITVVYSYVFDHLIFVENVSIEPVDVILKIQ